MANVTFVFLKQICLAIYLSDRNLSPYYWHLTEITGYNAQSFSDLSFTKTVILNGPSIMSNS